MIDVPWEHAALVVIDMQHSFLESSESGVDGSALDSPVKVALPGCLKLIDAAREFGVPIIYTRYVYHPGLIDFGLIRNERSRLRYERGDLAWNHPDTAFVPEIQPTGNEIVIDKSRPSAFYATRLEPVLSGLGVRNLIICGVTTNICVESTARDSSQRDLGTFVVRDAVGEFSAERHEYSLFTIDWVFGQTCMTGDVTDSWKRAVGYQAGIREKAI